MPMHMFWDNEYVRKLITICTRYVNLIVSILDIYQNHKSI